jgi:hypothetical protein
VAVKNGEKNSSCLHPSELFNEMVCSLWIPGTFTAISMHYLRSLCDPINPLLSLYNFQGSLVQQNLHNASGKLAWQLLAIIPILVTGKSRVLKPMGIDLEIYEAGWIYMRYDWSCTCLFFRTVMYNARAHCVSPDAWCTHLMQCPIFLQIFCIMGLV